MARGDMERRRSRRTRPGVRPVFSVTTGVLNPPPQSESYKDSSAARTNTTREKQDHNKDTTEAKRWGLRAVTDTHRTFPAPPPPLPHTIPNSSRTVSHPASHPATPPYLSSLTKSRYGAASGRACHRSHPQHQPVAGSAQRIPTRWHGTAAWHGLLSAGPPLRGTPPTRWGRALALPPGLPLCYPMMWSPGPI